MKAFGCQQTAANPLVCAGGIADSVAVIVEDSTWQALRLGLNADLPIVDRWRVDLEGAWLPMSGIRARTVTCCSPRSASIPIRQDGHGWGYQLEAILSYQSSTRRSASASAGATGTCRAKVTRISRTLGGSPQPLDFKVDIYGVFLQGSYRFGPF